MNIHKSLLLVSLLTIFTGNIVLAQETPAASAPVAPSSTPVTPTQTQTQAAPVVATTVAQNPEEESNFRFGFKVAPNIGWIKEDSKGWSSDGSEIGFSYGLMAEFDLSKNYSFVTGAQVAYRQGKLKQEISPDTTLSFDVNLQYVEFPIAIKMKTNKNGKFKYFGQFGLNPGINYRAKANTPDEDEVNIDASVKSMNLAMVLGAGTEITLQGTTILMVSLEYNNGFIDIFKSYDGGSGNESYLTGYSNLVALNVGIMF
jgi:hypothetical protein